MTRCGQTIGFCKPWQAATAAARRPRHVRAHFGPTHPTTHLGNDVNVHNSTARTVSVHSFGCARQGQDLGMAARYHLPIRGAQIVSRAPVGRLGTSRLCESKLSSSAAAILGRFVGSDVEYDAHEGNQERIACAVFVRICVSADDKDVCRADNVFG